MEIFEVPVQGFCGGVRRAVDLARKTVRENPDRKVTVLGSLVHNAYVNDELRSMGVEIVEAKGKTRLDLLDDVEDGILIFTAHGVSDKVREKAKAKGLECIDASCPFVLSTQSLIKKKRAEGYTIFYIGKKGHPEAEGAMESEENFFLIEKKDDLPEEDFEKIFVTNQTTMSVLDLEDLFDEIKARYPHAEFCSEICTATRLRQQAVMDLQDKSIDLLIVIGDPQSNNTRKLSLTGKKAGIERILQIESSDDLRKEDFENVKKVAVTSGASTPDFLLKDVIARLHSF